LTQLVKTDSNVRLVFKEYPILSPESVIAAKIALAAQKQGKYEAVHMAFMSHKGSFEQQVLLDLAASVGADPARLQGDMKDPAIMGALQANASLAHALGITGTPGFLFGKELVPGAISFDEMKSKVAGARAADPAFHLPKRAPTARVSPGQPLSCPLSAGGDGVLRPPHCAGQSPPL
jgi:protein-disulfide isomerase